MQKSAIFLKPSRWFRVWLFVLCLGSSIAIFSLSWAFFYKLILFFIVLLYSKQVYGQQQTIQALAFDANCFHAKTAREGWQEIEVLGDTTITGMVIVMRYTLTGKRRKHTCLLFSDSMSRQAYRQWVLTLRYWRK